MYSAKRTLGATRSRIGRILGSAAILFGGLAGGPDTPVAATIADTPHNLTGLGAGAGNQICTYCHTPKSQGQPEPAIWAGSGTEAHRFALYGIRTDVDAGDTPFLPPPRGVSMVCLSCHDGVTAWDALFANPRVSTAVSRTGAATIVGDLIRDHPVSMDYPPITDPGVSRHAQGTAGVLPLFRGFSNGGEELSRVECASCHNPHGGTMYKFLRMGTEGSNLCLNCHVK